MPDPIANQESPGSQAHRKTILVVDDNAANCFLMTAILETENINVMIARNGTQALVRVKETRPDLILLDVMMSGMNGYDVLRRLREDDTTACIPVIMVTALEDDESRRRALEAGANDILSKPVNMEDIIAKVDAILNPHPPNLLDNDA